MVDERDRFVKRVPLQRYTPPKRTAIKRKPKKGQRKPPVGFPENVKKHVRSRSRGICEVPSCSARANHFHHRKSRRFGDHRAVNTLHVCSDCHAWIHGNPDASYVLGYLVPSWQDPAEVPIR
jgi:hypothetical protein